MADTSDNADKIHALRDNPQAITMLTTEHFNLATARASTISEGNGRASIFLGAVSAALVAIAFAGQSSQTALYTFGLVLFPVLSFLGLTTFDRVLQASIDDTHFLQRINRIRRYYIDAAPVLGNILAQPAPTDEAGPVLRQEGFAAGRLQPWLSVVSAVGVINSVLIGVSAGMASAALSGDSLWVAVPVGLVVCTVVVLWHQRRQISERQAAHRRVQLFTD